MRLCSDRHSGAWALRAVIASDVDRQPVPFAAISAKTLIVGGADDQFFGDGAMDEAARLIPGSQLALLTHETHMAPIERARDIARVMSRFLQA